MIRETFSAGRDWKKFRHRRGGSGDMYREISKGKHTAADKRREAGEQPEGNHESTDELDPTANLSDHLIRAGHSTEHSEDQLTAMRGEHKTNNQSHQTINRISKSVESVHG